LFSRKFDHFIFIGCLQDFDSQLSGFSSISLSLLLSVNKKAPRISIAISQPFTLINETDWFTFFVADNTWVIILSG